MKAERFADWVYPLSEPQLQQLANPEVVLQLLEVARAASDMSDYARKTDCIALKRALNNLVIE